MLATTDSLVAPGDTIIWFIPFAFNKAKTIWTFFSEV